jgi:hypothetical protein
MDNNEFQKYLREQQRQMYQQHPYASNSTNLG